MNIQADINTITRRMFVTTADSNYIMARLAFFHELDFDFFWLSLHALEKYYKAILLINGSTAKKYSHKLTDLHSAVMTLEPRFPIGPFSDPAIEDLLWRDEPIERYLKRLDLLGSPDNRYATYGYSLRTDDLFKVDQLVWHVRRCCRQIRYKIPSLNGQIEIDHVKELRNGKGLWKLGSHTPIEDLLAKSDKDALRSEFLYLNIPFAPGASHALISDRSASHQPPFAEYFRLMNTPDADPSVRERSAEILRWAMKHIQFNRRDYDEILKALQAYDVSK